MVNIAVAVFITSQQFTFFLSIDNRTQFYGLKKLMYVQKTALLIPYETFQLLKDL